MQSIRLKSLRRSLSVALLATLASFAAKADSSVNGATLFANQCASCHGNSPLTSNTSKIYNGRNARNVIDSAISGNVGGMGSLRGAFPVGGTQLADVAAYLGNSPQSMNFAATNVGSSSAAQTLTIYASLKSGNALSALTLSTSGDFARSGGTCGTTVATGQNCTVLVTFTPTAAGARTGTLSITHNNTLSPISIALSGTGSAAAAPVANIAPASLTLADTAIGATSAAQNVNVSNSGNAALSISSIGLSNPADFVIAGGTCSAGGTVAAGSSCTVSVAFKPSAGATGLRSASLSIAHNAAGSPGSVSLSGNATAAAAPVALLTNSLAFGSVNVGSSSALQTATLSNTGTAPLNIAALSSSSADFVIAGGTCAAGGSVAVASSCSIDVRFTPAAAGARSANLVVTHNASGGSSSAALSGTGVALNPVIAVSPGTLSFSQTVAATSAAQTITVSNSGNAPLVLGSLAIGGAQAGDFQLASGTNCAAGGNVAAASSCVVKVSFTPSAVGARSASLSITHNAAGSPTSVALNGTGTASPQPAISLNTATLAFASQVLGSASAVRSAIVSNSGAAALTFSALTLTGTAAGDFARSGTCAATTTLAVGASCSLDFSFTPGALGARTATLTVASNATNGDAVLSLSGTGVPVPTPLVGLAPATLDFGNQTSGVASTARTVTLSNTGSGALSIASIGATGPFAVLHNCGASLAAGANCTLSVTFTPAGVGAASGNLSVASNAAGSPHQVSLSGTGVVASPMLAWLPATAALDFGDLVVGATPASRTLTLNNQGPGAVTLQQFTLAGAQAGDFSVGKGSTCAVATTLAQGSSCTLAVEFQSAAVGLRLATLQVVSSGTNPPDVALSGNGTATAQASVAVVPAALSFNLAADAGTGETQSLLLQSTGNAVLTVDALRVASGSFTLAAAAVNGCPATPFDLMPGQSCALSVGWSSNVPGTENGIVEIATSASAQPLQVPVQAVRESANGQTTAAPGGISNVGAGGCSIVRGHSLIDPTLWLLALAALGVLWHRRGKPAGLRAQRRDTSYPPRKD